MNWSCYSENKNPGKKNLISDCALLIGVYQGPYVITGQLTSFMNAATNVVPSAEYLIFILIYSFGVLVNTYVLGGITEILKNLNQGENFFIEKTDLLVDHMVYYEVSAQTQTDLKVYYDYIWQRHKDIIYGKGHFSILSKSLRERFENLNLPNNKLYLAKFYNLNIGNTKIIGKILMNLEKKILFPYEILFEEGSVCKGLYIVLNGEVELKGVKLQGSDKQTYSVNNEQIFRFLMESEKKNKYDPKSENELIPETFSNIFPLPSVLIKTGRIWHRSFSEEFCDLLHLPIKTFDELVENFPIEIHSLKHSTIHEINKTKIFENDEIFQIVSTHSSRSIGKYYEKDYNRVNIWIPIAIPFTQRKIAKDYIDCFLQKVKNQSKEIFLEADLNICLNGHSIQKKLKRAENDNKKVASKVEKVVTSRNVNSLEKIRDDLTPIENLVTLLYKTQIPK
jgi:hypothetical protein